MTNPTGGTTPPVNQAVGWRWPVGATLLLAALIAAATLAVAHVRGLSVPGCGPGSGCDLASKSVFGRVPGLDWPIAFVGAAYFAGTLVGWLLTRGRAAGIFAHLVRLGAVASVFYLGVMIVNGYVCSYCVASHVANLAFLVLMETRPRAKREGGPLAVRGVIATVVAGVLVSAGLGVWSTATKQVAAAQDESDLEASTAEIIEETAASATASTETPIDPDWYPNGFRGRYVIGPDAAPIRVVIFSDYQCEDCRRIEGELFALFEERDDMSISAKQFPMCSRCNPNMGGCPHPNACWAARAAETAGLIGGEEAFWRMHRWLFERGGSFTDQEIAAALPTLGFDAPSFLSLMQTPETLDLVQGDIEEAIDLGLFYTPMIFINGVQLRGWRAPNAVRRAVEAVAATNPPALTHANDRPPAATTKYIEDFLAEPRRNVPLLTAGTWMQGPSEGVEVVVFGDYQDEYTARADADLRRLLGRGEAIRYAFRHYPVNQSCNPASPVSRHPQACRAAMAAEAAGAFGGVDAFWAMHTWLLTHQDELDDDNAILSEAAALGLDPSQVLAAMDAAAFDQRTQADGAMAKRLGVRSIPMIFIDGRLVPRWWLDEASLLGPMIEAARD